MSAATSRALSSIEYVIPEDGRTTSRPSRDAIIDASSPLVRA
jgi:hypothetical protein